MKACTHILRGLLKRLGGKNVERERERGVGDGVLFCLVTE